MAALVGSFFGGWFASALAVFPTYVFLAAVKEGVSLEKSSIL